MFKIYQCYDVRANEFIGNPLVFLSDAEASLWFLKQKLCTDIELKKIGSVIAGDVRSCDIESVPVNAYEVDDE